MVSLILDLIRVQTGLRWLWSYLVEKKKPSAHCFCLDGVASVEKTLT